MKEFVFKMLESWGLVPRYASAQTNPIRSMKVLGPSPGSDEMLIGHLTIENTEYVFRYTHEYKRSAGPALSSFPDKTEEYRSRTLWPFFAVRIPPGSRKDVQELLNERKIDPADTFSVLGSIGARTAVSPYRLELSQAV